MKLILKIVGALAGVLAAFMVALYIAVLGGKAAIPDGFRYEAVQVVKDRWVSACLLEIGPGELALLDSGTDPDANAIIAALRKRGLSRGAVKAVLLTHGDADHTAGAHQFPQAPVMALAPDVDLAEGKVARGPLQSPHPTELRVTRAFKDGEVVELGAMRVEVFALPGHTPGSAAYLARGVLFLGDSAEIGKDGKLEPAAWPFCADRRQNRSSLLRLARRLEPRAGQVKAIVCAHTGVLVRGLAPLAELAAQLEKEATP